MNETIDPDTGEVLSGDPGMTPAKQQPGIQFFTADTPPETVAAAVKQLAMVHAHVAVAKQNPRDLAKVKERMLKHCYEPFFALAAEYVMPRGGKAIRGLSVRFAEAAFQELGNLGLDVAVLHDDGYRRTVKVTLHDFENNTERSEESMFEKSVERSDPGDRQVLGTRQNSNGKPVHTVRATLAETAQLQAVESGKLGRNLVLRFLSPEFKRECHMALRKAKVEAARSNPDFYREMLFDVAGRLNVDEDELLEFTGAPSWKDVTPDQLRELGEALEAVQSGDAKWWPILKPRREENERRRAAAQKQGGTAPAGAPAGQAATQRSEGKPSPTASAPTTPAPTSRQAMMSKASAFRAAEPDAWEVLLKAMGKSGEGIGTLTSEELGALCMAIDQHQAQSARAG